MTTLSIPDMSCGHCKAAVETAVKALDPAALLEFDMQARRVTVTTTAPDDALLQGLDAAGYPARGV